MSAVIQVTDLYRSFRKIKAVDGISFSVNEGEVYGFLGQNGAGKSTTIRILLSLIRPGSGRVELFGKNIRQHKKAILRQTGAIIERPDLYKYLTAFENLSLFARLSGVRLQRKQLMEQLERVGLADRAGSKVKTYSQGMKQRLGLAVALVHNPQLVILDEPTNGLDPQGIADVRQLIRHLSKDLGKTVFVSSHLLNEIEQVANRVLILHKGKVMAEGSSAELFDPAKTLLELDTTNNARALELLSQSAWQDSLKTGREGKLLVQTHKDRSPELVADLVKMDIGLLSLQPRNSLEDYFLSLTTAHVDPAAN